MESNYKCFHYAMKQNQIGYFNALSGNKDKHLYILKTRKMEQLFK